MPRYRPSEPDPQPVPFPLDPNSDAFPAGQHTTPADPGGAVRNMQTSWLLTGLAWVSGGMGGLLTLLGGLLAALTRRPLPTVILPLGELLRRAVALRPSGLLELGVGLLIASPILYLLAILRRRSAARTTDDLP